MTHEEPTENEKDELQKLIERTEFLSGIDEHVSGRLDGAIEHFQSIGVLEIYRRFIGKMEPKDTGKTEGVHISCPIPGHLDRNPSAWANTTKGVWFCGGCHEGGDVVDLLAISQGRAFPSYRDDPREFVEVLETGLRDTGVDPDDLRAVAEQKQSPPVAEPRQTPIETNETVETINIGEVQDFPYEVAPFDWRDHINHAEGTFLWEWMEATEVEDIPNEFLLWVGMQAVGLAVGRKAHIRGNIYPNLILALLGRTGEGKSRAVRLARTLVREGLPLAEDDIASPGVRLLPRPGSGEALIESLRWTPTSEDNPKGVRALLEFDEMKALMETVSRHGSTLRENIVTAVDSPDVMNSNTRSSGNIEAVDIFLALVTGGQPDAMQNILSKNDSASGFANRFLYIPATPKPMPLWRDIRVADLSGLAERLVTIRNRASVRNGETIIAEDAIAQFDQVRAWLRSLRLRPDGDMYARLELHLMKVIIILCVNQYTNKATPEIVESAHRLIESTLAATAEVSENVTQTVQEYYRSKIISCIETAEANSKKPPSVGDMNRSLRSDKREKGNYNLMKALKELENIGAIQECGIMEARPDGVPAFRTKRYYLPYQSRWWEVRV